MNGLTEVSAVRSFQGFQKVFKHASNVVKCDMKFGVYLPDTKSADEKLPVLFYLSGLTCSEANFIEKSGFQRFASQHRVIVVNPDTSPRGVKVDGDDESWDFGVAAGFYLDATVPKWANNYRMYSYIVEELLPLVSASFPVDDAKRGIFGHSMGGHGALTIGLKNPDKFKSISAFSAICNPSQCPWGQKALNGYLGPDQAGWAQYDATELARKYDGPQRIILLDQGEGDKFLKDQQLLPENLSKVENSKLKFDYRLRPQYDHSYYYIATFIEEHFAFHVDAFKSA
ncbi:Protein Y48G10A.1 [Aphelenchoides avenae]|nr:Protein Y48G10A.1 [Aphelenchus avenae]